MLVSAVPDLIEAEKYVEFAKKLEVVKNLSNVKLLEVDFANVESIEAAIPK
jgi:hypothetical protein